MSTETIAETAEAATAAVQAGQATSSISIQIAPRHAYAIGAGVVAYVTAKKLVPVVKAKLQERKAAGEDE